MNTARIMPAVLVSAGLLGLLLTGLQALAAPAWCWLALVGAGAAFPLAWRAAGVRRVSSRERKRNEVRLRNAARRERRLLRKVERVRQAQKETLAEVHEHPDLAWGHKIAAVVRTLQDGMARHEEALRANKILTDRTAEQLGAVLGREE